MNIAGDDVSSSNTLSDSVESVFELGASSPAGVNMDFGLILIPIDGFQQHGN